MDREVLFSTIHGSFLYGTAHENSDRDFFKVVTKLPHVAHNSKARYAKQTIKDGVDETVVDLSTFMEGCRKGVPQYLEAMFSRKAEVDKIEAFRYGFRVGTEVLPTYLRTIKSFSFDERDGGVKKRRHALRLALNARDIATYGWFDPTLSCEQARTLLELAKQDGETIYDLACAVAFGSATI